LANGLSFFSGVANRLGDALYRGHVVLRNIAEIAGRTGHAHGEALDLRNIAIRALHLVNQAIGTLFGGRTKAANHGACKRRIEAS
jgi:hypothetical protein